MAHSHLSGQKALPMRACTGSLVGVRRAFGKEVAAATKRASNNYDDGGDCAYHWFGCSFRSTRLKVVASSMKYEVLSKCTISFIILLLISESSPIHQSTSCFTFVHLWKGLATRYSNLPFVYKTEREETRKLSTDFNNFYNMLIYCIILYYIVHICLYMYEYVFLVML